jgi:diguanylate cyclase (GGDEF)-like protein
VKRSRDRPSVLGPTSDPRPRRDVGSHRVEGRSQAWPTSALVRVAALAARLLDVPAAILTVAVPGGEIPSVRIVVDGDGSTVEPPPGRRIPISAAIPLVSTGGTSLGRLEVAGRRARSLTADALATLRDLARILADEVELEDEARRERAANRERVELELQGAQDVANVATAVRSFSALEDPESVRRAIGEIALQLTGADSAAILDVVGEEMHFVKSSSAGSPWTLPDASLSDKAAPAATAYKAGRPVLLPDPADAASENADEGPSARPFTLWQPFAAGGRSSVALLALAWEGPLTIEPPRLTDLTELLAIEATLALERADLLAQLAGLARTDELTGLPNRRAIYEDLAREMERAKRQQTDLCVGLLDLDYFKRFNDTRGHPAGDALLAEAATAWRDALRAGSDTLGRYGGEEFLVVLPAPPDEALKTVERLRRLTPQHQTASAGIASWNGAEAVEGLVARADVALYTAKARGRDRSEMAAAPTDQLPEKRLVGVFGVDAQADGPAEGDTAKHRRPIST